MVVNMHASDGGDLKWLARFWTFSSGDGDGCRAQALGLLRFTLGWVMNEENEEKGTVWNDFIAASSFPLPWCRLIALEWMGPGAVPLGSLEVCLYKAGGGTSAGGLISIALQGF